MTAMDVQVQSGDLQLPSAKADERPMPATRQQDNAAEPEGLQVSLPSYRSRRAISGFQHTSKRI